jgi:hypothetical protein
MPKLKEEEAKRTPHRLSSSLKSTWLIGKKKNGWIPTEKGKASENIHLVGGPWPIIHSPFRTVYALKTIGAPPL